MQNTQKPDKKEEFYFKFLGVSDKFEINAMSNLIEDEVFSSEFE